MKYEADSNGTVMCGHCPVLCKIKPLGYGACQMYKNINGEVVRDKPLTIPAERLEVNYDEKKALSQPLIHASGAGTEYPDFVPAPGIIESQIDGIDVVTCITEVPLSYCSVKVKIDTNMDIGTEGSVVRRGNHIVGHVTTEEYGAKMLAIGGINLISNKGGFQVARTMADICNYLPVSLHIQDGAELDLQLGNTPIINGEKQDNMRVGCGSATLGIFAFEFMNVADETIVIDPHVTGLLTEHAVGRMLGMPFSGITPVGRRSSIGRYFGTPGSGMGGTNIQQPIDAIAKVDMNLAWPGMTVFVVDTNGQNAALLRLAEDGTFHEIPLTAKAAEMQRIIAETSEPSRVHVQFTGGIGGSARASISEMPIEVNKAVHAGKIQITMCGAPVSLMPGGNIIFSADVSKIPVGSFYVTPTPAIIVPVEYTMTRATFQRIKGRYQSLQNLNKFLHSKDSQLL
jgi:6-hydroxynicotinate reductase